MVDTKKTIEVIEEPVEWTAEMMEEYADVEADGIQGLKDLGLITETE